MKVSVILPARNEEKTIKPYLLELIKTLPNAEFIVVCNGCTDRTEGVVKSIKSKRIKVFSIPEAAKGLAVLFGFEKVSDTKYIGFVDGDGAFSSKVVKMIINELKKNDVAIASKWKNKKFYEVNEPFFRKICGRVWNFLVKLMFGLNFSDTQAGLKFMRMSIWKKMKRDFVCKGFAFDVELLYRARLLGCKIKEIPTDIKRTSGSFTLKYTPKMLYELLKLRLTTLF